MLVPVEVDRAQISDTVTREHARDTSDDMPQPHHTLKILELKSSLIRAYTLSHTAHSRK